MNSIPHFLGVASFSSMISPVLMGAASGFVVNIAANAFLPTLQKKGHLGSDNQSHFSPANTNRTIWTFPQSAKVVFNVGMTASWALSAKRVGSLITQSPLFTIGWVGGSRIAYGLNRMICRHYPCILQLTPFFVGPDLGERRGVVNSF